MMDSTLSQFKREAEIYGVRKYDLREPKMVEIATFEKYAELIVFECIRLAVDQGDAITALAIREKFLNSKTGVGKTSEGSENV
jgi:hypothetical protein